MLHDLLWPLQCHDVQPKAAALEIKQLVEDERLRQTRETVGEDDEIDLSAMSAPCDCPGAQLPRAAPQVSRAEDAPVRGRPILDVRAAATNVTEEDPPEARQCTDRRP